MWQRIEVAGKPCDVFEPSRPGAPGAVLFLPGAAHSTHVAEAALGDRLGEYGLRAVVPSGGAAWWLDALEPDFDERLTPERLILQHVLPAIAERWGVAPPKVALLGVGTGGQAVLRMCFQTAQRFPVTAALLPALDFHEIYGRGTALDTMFASKEFARQQTALLHVHPLNRPRHLFFAADPRDTLWFDGARRLHEKLAAIGVPHTCDLETSFAGDARPYLAEMLPRALEFVTAGLGEVELPVVS